MPTTRSYLDGCGIARALDVVGERWALLVVRELLLGPMRFADLRRALPGASSNLVADRLRELEAHGVLARRTLPPPGAAKVYELTDRGRELEPILLALGGWGLQVPQPTGPTTLSATSVLLYLRGSVDPGEHTYRVELDGRVWTVRSGKGDVLVEPGEPAHPAGSLRTDPQTLNALLDEPATLREAIAAGRAEVTGDPTPLITPKSRPSSSASRAGATPGPSGTH
ncbi:winged helix-turn-helix transcriptional regulator [Micromonosporaceae bacterium Da 78-11]